MEYIVYCEWYGKKIKVIVDAESVSSAKIKIRQNIIFHKIKPGKDDVVDKLKEMFEIKDNL